MPCRKGGIDTSQVLTAGYLWDHRQVAEFHQFAPPNTHLPAKGMGHLAFQSPFLDFCAQLLRHLATTQVGWMLEASIRAECTSHVLWVISELWVDTSLIRLSPNLQKDLQNTVDGRNPAPVDRWWIPLFIPLFQWVSMGFNGFQWVSTIRLVVHFFHPPVRNLSWSSPGHRGDSATGRHGRHGRHGPPGEEGEAKAAEAEALETAGRTRQRLGKKYVKSMGIYGDIHVDIWW